MRFILRFCLGLGLLASLGLLALYAGTSAEQLQAQLAVVLPPALLEQAMNPVLTSERYVVLRLVLAAVAASSALALGLTWGPGRKPAGRRKLGLRCSLSGWWHWWTLRSRGERRLLLGWLLAAVALRIWMAVAYPLTPDELASYDYFVLPGPAITASYYSYPNNHLLANLLAGLVHAALPAVSGQVALRLLPTLLGLAVLPLGYRLLLRYLPFAAATVGWGLFTLAPLPVFYAMAGRGYGYTLAALLAGLGASLKLLRPQPAPRSARQRAWGVFCLSAVLGLYAVPTYLYALVGLGLALAVGFGCGPRRRRWVALGQLAGAGLGIGAVVLVLYAPVLAVSGWRSLAANPYVVQLRAAEFWRLLGPYYLVGTSSELFGQGWFSLLGIGGLAVAVPVLLLRSRRLPEPSGRLGWLLYAQLLGWVPLLLVQRVFAPARTLLPVLLSSLVLGALLGQEAWQRVRPARPRSWLPGVRLAVLALGLASYGSYRNYRDSQIWRRHGQREQELRRAYAWLRAQRPALVLLPPANDNNLLLQWQHYALDAGLAPLPLATAEQAPRLAPATRQPLGPVYEVVTDAPPGRVPVYAAPGLVILAER